MVLGSSGICLLCIWDSQDDFQGSPNAQMFPHWRQFQQAHLELAGAMGTDWFPPFIYPARQPDSWGDHE